MFRRHKILSAGADICPRSKLGYIPLDVQIERREYDVVGLLVKGYFMYGWVAGDLLRITVLGFMTLFAPILCLTCVSSPLSKLGIHLLEMIEEALEQLHPQPRIQSPSRRSNTMHAQLR